MAKGILSRYNGGRVFDAQTDGLSFVKIGTLELGKEYPFKGFFFTNGGRYGETPVLITEGALVNAPRHLATVLHEMIEDAEAVELINAGKAVFTVYEYESKEYKTKCRGVAFGEVY